MYWATPLLDNKVFERKKELHFPLLIAQCLVYTRQFANIYQIKNEHEVKISKKVKFYVP